jgi:hypothetical protein
VPFAFAASWNLNSILFHRKTRRKIFHLPTSTIGKIKGILLFPRNYLSLWLKLFCTFANVRKFDFGLLEFVADMWRMESYG